MFECLQLSVLQGVVLYLNANHVYKWGVSNRWNGIWNGTVEWKMEWSGECM